MKSQKGFTLIELLIVVAIIGIIASIAIPSLVRARVSANEAAALGDIRTVISAQAAYKSANSGFYDGQLTCLTSPVACIPSYPSVAPTFLDSQLAAQNPKSGYNRLFTGGAPITGVATASGSGTAVYSYDATPIVPGQTGVRGFGADASGRMCFTPDGTAVGSTGGILPMSCNDLR